MADLLLLQILQGECVGRRGGRRGSDFSFRFVARNVAITP